MPQYEATARVVLPQSELAATLAGIQPVYVDPERHDDAEQNLAEARELFARASIAANGALGNGRYVRSVDQRRRGQQRRRVLRDDR